METKKVLLAVLVFLLAFSAFIPAALAADTIEFTAALSAEGTWIPPEGVIDFTVVIENTGAVDIDRFEIITPNGILVAEYGDLPVGQSASVAVHPIAFDNPGEYPVELFVVGYRGGDSWTGHTNELIVTVSSDPEPSPTPEPAIAPAESSEQTPEPAAVETAPAEPTASPAESETAANANPVSANDNTLLYAAIAALGTLAVAIVVIIIVVAARKKKTE